MPYYKCTTLSVSLSITRLMGSIVLSAHTPDGMFLYICSKSQRYNANYKIVDEAYNTQLFEFMEAVFLNGCITFVWMGVFSNVTVSWC